MAKKPKKSDQPQKFVDMARELEADEDEAAFDEKLRRIAKQKPDKPKPQKRRRSTIKPGQ